MKKMKQNFGKMFNDMKNNELAKELQDFLDDKYAENEENMERCISLLKVIVGRLKTLKDKSQPARAKRPYAMYTMH